MALRDRMREALDADEREERESKLDARLEKIEQSITELRAAPGEDDDELAALAQQLKETREELAELKKAKAKPKPKAKPADDDDAPKTRQGRKSGNAYDWDVDDDGNVRKLDIARVYQGEDEPDEVELPEAASA